MHQMCAKIENKTRRRRRRHFALPFDIFVYIWQNCTYDCCLYIVFHARMVLFRFIFGMRSIGIWPRIYKMQRHYHYHVCMLSGNIEHLW